MTESLRVNLRRELQARGMSQSELAASCGWAPSRITELLQGPKTPKLSTVDTIAKALNVPAPSLLMSPAETFSEKIG